MQGATYRPFLEADQMGESSFQGRSGQLWQNQKSTLFSPGADDNETDLYPYVKTTSNSIFNECPN